MYKPYGERYLGLVEDILENPPEETPGWHASEQETSIMMAYDESNVRMERAVEARAHAPEWMPPGFAKSDGAWDAIKNAYFATRFDASSEIVRKATAVFPRSNSIPE